MTQEKRNPITKKVIKEVVIDPNGVLVIPNWSMTLLGLSGLKRDLYSIIWNSTSSEHEWYIHTVEYLAKMTGSTVNGVQKAIKALEDENLIIRKHDYSCGNVIVKTYYKYNKEKAPQPLDVKETQPPVPDRKFLSADRESMYNDKPSCTNINHDGLGRIKKDIHKHTGHTNINHTKTGHNMVKEGTGAGSDETVSSIFRIDTSLPPTKNELQGIIERFLVCELNWKQEDEKYKKVLGYCLDNMKSRSVKFIQSVIDKESYEKKSFSKPTEPQESKPIVREEPELARDENGNVLTF